MEANRIWTDDLGATVRCFIGPFVAFIFGGRLMQIGDDHSPDEEVLVETAVSIFLAGMAYARGQDRVFRRKSCPL